MMADGRKMGAGSSAKARAAMGVRLRGLSPACGSASGFELTTYGRDALTGAQIESDPAFVSLALALRTVDTINAFLAPLTVALLLATSGMDIRGDRIEHLPRGLTFHCDCHRANGGRWRFALRTFNLSGPGARKRTKVAREWPCPLQSPFFGSTFGNRFLLGPVSQTLQSSILCPQCVT